MNTKNDKPTFRILEKDGYFKIQKWVKTGSVTGSAPFWKFHSKGVIEKEVFNFVDRFYWDGDEIVEEAPLYLYLYLFSLFSADGERRNGLELVLFDSKESAISWIEYFYGQNYELEEGEWRIV